MVDRRETYVALLRGINVGGKNRIPMVGLRALCAEIGCTEVRTYIQSGNVVFSSSMSAAALEERLEGAIREEFDLAVPVIVRAASSWSRYVEANPFADEATSEANRVLLCLSKHPPRVTAAAELQERATQGERVVNEAGAIWVHYANGIARSKLAPAVLDRLVGSSVTARNWRTVSRLEVLARATTGE